MHAWSDLSVLQIMLGYVQVIGAFPSVLDVDWPAFFTEWTNLIDVIDLEI